MKAPLPILAVIALSHVGCASMPESFQPGNPDTHPRFGYRITNENAGHFDLEIIVVDSCCFCRGGDHQLEAAKKVFLEFLRDVAREKRLAVEEPPLVELNVFQVRGAMGITSSTRVSKRIRVVSTREKGGKRLLLSHGGLGSSSRSSE